MASTQFASGGSSDPSLLATTPNSNSLLPPRGRGISTTSITEMMEGPVFSLVTWVVDVDMGDRGQPWLFDAMTTAQVS